MGGQLLQGPSTLGVESRPVARNWDRSPRTGSPSSPAESQGNVLTSVRQGGESSFITTGVDLLNPPAHLYTVGQSPMR